METSGGRQEGMGGGDKPEPFTSCNLEDDDDDANRLALSSIFKLVVEVMIFSYAVN